MQNEETPTEVNPFLEIASSMYQKPAQPVAQPDNPFMELAPSMRALSQPPAIGSLSAVMGINPDQAAEATKLGTPLGIGQDLGLRNMDELRRRSMIASVKRSGMLQNNPRFAESLLDPVFAAQAHDDLDSLNKTSSLFDKVVSVFDAPNWMFGFKTVAEVTGGVERGLGTVERGELGSKQMFGSATQEQLARLEVLDKKLGAIPPGGIVSMTAEVVAQQLATIRSVGTTALIGAGVGAAVSGPAAPVGAAGGFLAGGAAGLMATTTQTEAGNLYRDMVNQGVDPDTAQYAALTGGLLNGIIELAGAKIAAGPFKALASKYMKEAVGAAVAKPTARAAMAIAGKEYAKQVGTETAEEVGQELVAITTEEIAKAMDGIDSETSFKDAMTRLVDAGIAGFQGSLVLGGIGPTSNFVVDLRRAEATTKQQEFFDGLDAAKRDGKLPKRNLDAYEGFLARQAKGTTADTVYVEAEAAAQVLAQSGLSVTELEKVLPGIREQLQNALENGGDITIPTSVYGAKLSGTQLGDALRPHMRLSPEAMSVAQAQEFSRKRDALRQEAQAALAERQEADAAFVESAQKVETTMAEQLRQTGMQDIEVRANAELFRDLAVTQAARMGITPEQFYERYPYRVRGPQVVQEGQPLEQVREVVDPVGREYLEGTTELEVVAFEPYQEGQTNEATHVVRTLQPIVRQNGQIIQRGQVVVREGSPQYLARQEQVQEAKKAEMRARLVGAQQPLEQAAQIPKVDGVALRRAMNQYIRNEIYARELIEEVNLFGLVTEEEVEDLLDQDEKNRVAGVSSRGGGSTSIPIEMGRRGQHPLLALVRQREKERPTAIQRRDAFYLDAVQRDDIDQAEYMVDQAAYAQGYQIEAFHGTDAKDFAAFKYGDTYNWGPALYFSPSREYATEYQDRTGEGEPRVMRVKLRIENMFSPESNPEHLALYRRLTQEARDEGLTHQEFDISGPQGTKVKYGNTGLSNLVTYTDQWWLVEKLWREGFDGFRTTEADGETVGIAVRDPSQVKLADPVTYDESGNVVPLSRRFDITSPKVFEQAAIVRSGAETLEKYGLDPSKKYKTREVAAALEARQRDKYGLIGPKDRSRESIEKIANWMVEEVEFEMQNPEKSGVGWYSEKFQRALDRMGDVFPELKTDQTARNLMTVLIALTSDGQKVVPNFAQAMDIYGNFRDTGRFTTSKGHARQESIDKNLAVVQRLYDTMGADKMHDYLMQEETVSELKKLAEKAGGKMKSDYQAHIKLPLAAIELGPKLGAFYANLMGAHGYLTMDRWWSRTFNRYRGTLLQSNTRSALDKFKKLIGNESLSDDEVLSAVVEPRTAYEKRGFKTRLAVLVGKSEPSKTVEKLKWMEEAKTLAGDQFDAMLQEHQVERAANTIYKTAFENIEDAPFNATDRTFMLESVNSAQKMLESKGISISIADIQAILWYYEKRLYGELGARQTADVSYEDAAATVAARYASGQGIDDLLNDSGTASEDGDGIAGGVPVGEDEFDGDGGILEQAAAGPARGDFDPAKLMTTLREGRDFSTFAHETAHFYLTILADIARSATGPQQTKADMDALLSWFGIEGATPAERLASWSSLTIDQQRQYHEQFAYSFEIYLHDGKAPSVEMQSLFNQFAAWLKRVYKSIRDELNATYKAQFGRDLPMMNSEIRLVMDRMLATDEQIARAQAVRGMKAMFQTQEQSGMNDAEWAAYQALEQDATDAATAELTKATLKELQWYGNAQSKYLREIQSKHDRARKEIREEVSAQVQLEPVYRAMEFLKKGTIRTDTGEVTAATGAFKLDLAKVRAIMPAGFDPATLKYGKYGMVQEGGIDPDMAAGMFGYGSGVELINAILGAKPIKEEIDARTDQRMLDENSDLATPEARQAAVDMAIHNEARARFIAVEQRWLEKSTRPVNDMMQAARQVAQDIIGDVVIRTLNPRRYEAAEAEAARTATTAYREPQDPSTAGQAAATRSYNEAIAAGQTPDEATVAATEAGVAAVAKAQERRADFNAKYGGRDPAEVARRAKRQQLVQNQLAREAMLAKEEIAVAGRDFRKFFRSDEKLAKTRDMAPIMAARAILSYYGYGKRGESPAQYLEQLRTYAPELYDQIAPIVLKSLSGTADYRDLTVTEFRVLRDTVQALWAQARRDRQITVEGERVALDVVLKELTDRLQTIGVGERVGQRQAPGVVDQANRHLLGLRAMMSRVEAWADALDGMAGPGAFTKYLFRPVKQAVDAYRIERNKYVERFVKLLDGIDLPVGKIAAPELNYTFGNGNGGIGMAELLGALMHTGNEGNYRKLLLGRGWGELDADGNLDDSRWRSFIARMIAEGKLTKADYDFVQSIWDLLEEIKPLAQRAHFDMYGYYFKEVEATEVVTPFGTYRGGYVPAATDKFMVQDARLNEDLDALDGDWRNSLPSTGAGFTKGRVEYNEALSLDLRLIATHTDAVLRFSMIQPAVKDANKLLTDRDFAALLARFDPTAYQMLLKPWLMRAARQQATEPGRWKVADKFWGGVRSRAGVATMFANLRNALQQFTGWFPSLLKVKRRYLQSALMTYLGSPKQTAEAVARLSPFMADRMRNQMFELQGTMNELLLNPSKYEKLQQWSSKHGYFLQQAFQNMVDVTTWQGAYNQALAEGETQAEAVARGDAAVRLTQGSLSPEDKSMFEVGTPFYNTFVQFTGYFNMLANLNLGEFQKTVRDMGWRSGKGRLLYIYVMGMLLPAIVSDAIVRSLGGGWDDEDEDGYLWVFMDWFFGSQVRMGAALLPFGSTAYTAITTAFNDKPYDDRITTSPSIAALESATIGTSKAIIAVTDEDKDVTGRNVRDVLTLITLLTGVPVSALGRPAGYLIDVERGEIEPESGYDMIRGMITGTATPESKR